MLNQYKTQKIVVIKFCFEGPKHRQRFLCEVRVDGFTFVGVGNSTNKKDAQSNAARDFINFLVRQALVSPNEVPTDLGLVGGNGSVPGKLIALYH